MKMENEPYGQATLILPRDLRAAALGLPAELQNRAEEFRLRKGQPMSVVTGCVEVTTDSAEVTGEDLSAVVGQASGYSVHSVRQQLSCGYLTVRGGHRIGLCGEAVVKDGEVAGFRNLSSLSVRIARQIREAGETVVHKLLGENGAVSDTLILAPPGGGKTTLLRDVVRRLSDGIGARPHRIGLADERRELSALWDGQAQFDLGRRTDVIVDCPKADAAQILVRGMNPQVLAMDEITAEADIEALLWAAGCGVRLLASAHGEDLSSLQRRKIYRKMMGYDLFQRVVIVGERNGVRSYQVEVIR